MAILIKTDGRRLVVHPENETDFSLAELYKMLDCEMVQVIELDGGRWMIFDEEGKLKPERVNQMNHVATHEAALVLRDGDYIAGHALICERKEFK